MANFHISAATYMTYKFFAVPKNNGEIAKLIRCMTFSEKVNILISPAGMVMTVEEGKCMQVKVFLKRELFQVYHLKDDEEIFLKMSLKEMLDCLKKMASDGSRFSKNTTDSISSGLKIHFMMEEDDSVFKMTLVEDIVETYFRIKIEEYDELIEFDEIDVAVRIMLKSQEVWEFFKTLEDVSPDIIGLSIVPKKSLTISAVCNEGSVELIIPTTSSAIDFFTATEAMKSSYKMSNIKHAIKIMPLSSRCALKLNPDGILSFSFLIEGAESESFVEYHCIPQVVDEQDDGFE